MLGGLEILSPLESGVNSRFCSALNVGKGGGGGAEILSPSE